MIDPFRRKKPSLSITSQVKQRTYIDPANHVGCLPALPNKAGTRRDNNNATQIDPD
jgi:hypothetical protein